jgi:hypothetical protein
LYVLEDDGTVTFSFSTGGDIRTSPGFVEIDGNEIVYIFFGSSDRKIYGIDAQGNLLPGWPFTTGGSVFTSPIFGDIDGDGSPEVISAAANGNIYALHMDGSSLPNFPITTGSIIKSPCALQDSDNDGDVEIIIGSVNYVFNVDMKFSAGNLNFWNIYRGNPLRNGRSGDVETSIKSRVYTDPSRFYLYPNYPNPFNPETNILIELPETGDYMLTIYDITGRTVWTTRWRQKKPGLRNILWSGRSIQGKELPSGVYLYQLSGSDKTVTKKMVMMK